MTRPPYSLEVEVDRLPALNSSRNVHWRVKQRERHDWGWILRKAVGLNIPREPLKRADVTFIRRSSRKCDYTNLVSSFKLIEDLLQPNSTRNPGGLGIIAGDDPDSVSTRHLFEKTTRKGAGVRIIVEEVRGG